jgi:hypothetical protein
MTNIKELTISEIQRIIAIKEQIEKLQGQAGSIADGHDSPIPLTAKKPRRRMSRAGRASIIAAVKARWDKVRGNAKPKAEPAKKRDRRSSPAVRAKLAEAARARWAKVKAAGKKTL